MRQLEFEELCREASLALALEDTGALGQGFTVQLEDVFFETSFQEDRPNFLLMAEMGTIEPEGKQAIYQNLLTLQLMTWLAPGMCFGFNPGRQTLILCIDCSLGATSNGEWLAKVMRDTATTVATWRTTLLVLDTRVPNETATKLDAAMDELFPQYE